MEKFLIFVLPIVMVLSIAVTMSLCKASSKADRSLELPDRITLDRDK